MKEVLLFSTNIENKKDLQLLSPVLDQLFGKRWHVDLWSEDRLLRLIGYRHEITLLYRTLHRYRFTCEEIEEEVVVVAEKATGFQLLADSFLGVN